MELASGWHGGPGEAELLAACRLAPSVLCRRVALMGGVMSATAAAPVARVREPARVARARPVTTSVVSGCSSNNLSIASA